MKTDKNKILDRLSELYFNQGIKSVTMDDASEELGISKKTLYRLFRDKNDLIEQIVLYITGKNQGQIERLKSEPNNAIDQLYFIVKKINEIQKKHNRVFENDLKKFYPEVYQLLLKKRLDFMYNTLLENLKKGKEEGLYRSKMNEKIISRLHLSGIERIPEDKVLSIDEYISPESFHEIFEYHIRGIANNKGIEILELKLSNKKLKSKTL